MQTRTLGRCIQSLKPLGTEVPVKGHNDSYKHSKGNQWAIHYSCLCFIHSLPQNITLQSFEKFQPNLMKYF